MGIELYGISQEEKSQTFSAVAQILGVDKNDQEHQKLISTITEVECLKLSVEKSFHDFKKSVEQTFSDVDQVAKYIKMVANGDKQTDMVINVFANLYKKTQEQKVEAEIASRINILQEQLQLIGSTNKEKFNDIIPSLIVQSDNYRKVLDSVCMESSTIRWYDPNEFTTKMNRLNKVFDMFARIQFYKDYYIPNIVNYLSALEKGDYNAKYEGVTYEMKKGVIALSLNGAIPGQVAGMLLSEDESKEWPIICQYIASNECTYTIAVIKELDLDCTKFSKLANDTVLSDNQAHKDFVAALADQDFSINPIMKVGDTLIGTILSIAIVECVMNGYILGDAWITSSPYIWAAVSGILVFLIGRYYLKSIEKSAQETYESGMDIFMSEEDYSRSVSSITTKGWLKVLACIVFASYAAYSAVGENIIMACLAHLLILSLVIYFLLKANVSLLIFSKLNNFAKINTTHQNVVESLKKYLNMK